MSNELIATIITAVIALLGFLGVRLKVGKVLIAIKESTDVGMAISSAVNDIDLALKDSLVTPEEVAHVKDTLKSIKAELKQAQDAWNDLLSKIK